MKPKISELTPEQMRIMCAEACGYEWRIGIYGNCRGLFHPSDPYLKEQKCKESDMLLPVASDASTRCPSYDKSLDAMAEAEKTLDFHEKKRYARILRDLIPQEHIGEIYGLFIVASATAIQRLCAFLIAKGLAE